MDPTPNDSPTLLVAQGLKKRYGRREVVRGVDFTLGPKEIVALLGPNGAGKTTSFYMLAGFIRPDAGEIWLKGQKVTRTAMYKRARLGLGYLPQEPSAFRRMSVLDNLLAVLEYQSLTKKERLDTAMELLEEFHIAHLKDSLASALSGGERRRLEIARALTTRPDFILLDEPFTGVDPKNVQDIQKMIAELRDQREMAIFITDHSVRETLAITDRVYLMYDGSVVFQGPPSLFAEDPAARQYYLGEAFEL